MDVIEHDGSFHCAVHGKTWGAVTDPDLIDAPARPGAAPRPLLGLPAGTRFRVNDRTGTLVRATASRAVVRWDAQTDQDGVRTPPYQDSVASNCEVDVLADVR